MKKPSSDSCGVPRGRPDGRADRHDAGNIRFSQFLRTRQKKSFEIQIRYTVPDTFYNSKEDQCWGGEGPHKMN